MVQAIGYFEEQVYFLWIENILHAIHKLCEVLKGKGVSQNLTIHFV